MYSKQSHSICIPANPICEHQLKHFHESVSNTLKEMRFVRGVLLPRGRPAFRRAEASCRCWLCLVRRLLFWREPGECPPSAGQVEEEDIQSPRCRSSFHQPSSAADPGRPASASGLEGSGGGLCKGWCRGLPFWTVASARETDFLLSCRTHVSPQLILFSLRSSWLTGHGGVRNFPASNSCSVTSEGGKGRVRWKNFQAFATNREIAFHCFY